MVKRKPGQHREAVDCTVAALATGPEHAALVESCRALADELDQSLEFDEHMWREYRLALKALMDRMPDGGSDDDFDAEFDALSTEVGDSSNS